MSRDAAQRSRRGFVATGGQRRQKSACLPILYLFRDRVGVNRTDVHGCCRRSFQGKVFGLIYGLLEGAVGIGAAFGAWVAAPRRAFAGIYGAGQRQKT
ncbi:MAG: hypothetical protein JRI96_03765 [Deltaproteobacteria bacterium]|nr:hypothetical protein [Deltaproteobacteria bacterium]MBW2298811.1 hypothetical protein [Deltaproteobacteria bacterium]